MEFLLTTALHNAAWKGAYVSGTEACSTVFTGLHAVALTHCGHGNLWQERRSRILRALGLEFFLRSGSRILRVLVAKKSDMVRAFFWKTRVGVARPDTQKPG